MFNEGKEAVENGRRDDRLLEQYKLYVAMADRTGARRLSTTLFFLTINVAIVVLVSYLHSWSGQPQIASPCWLVAIAGIVLSFMWYRLIRYYRRSNTAKSTVIHEIEKRLPLNPHGAEWKVLGRGKKTKAHVPFPYVEVVVPWVFVGIHLAVFVQAVQLREIIQILWNLTRL